VLPKQPHQLEHIRRHDRIPVLVVYLADGQVAQDLRRQPVVRVAALKERHCRARVTPMAALQMTATISMRQMAAAFCIVS